MTRFTQALVSTLMLASCLRAAEIVLVYPHLESTGNPHVYGDNVDSTFVLGRVEPPTGELSVNGFPVVIDDRGAFLAWLPLRKHPGQRSWELMLKHGAKQIATLIFPYGLASENVSNRNRDTFRTADFPRVVRVIVPHGHMRTSITGTYDAFPELGGKLLAVGHEGGFYCVKLCDGLFEDIESEYVKLEPDSALTPVLLGNGRCERQQDRVVCDFAIERPVAWSAELSADQRSLMLTLFGVVAGSNRIRYDVSDSLVHEIVWEQLPGRLALQIHCTRSLVRGFSLAFRNNRLQIRIAGPLAKDERSLRGKVIVLDPGHGGGASGAVGPLGTKEKDVVLKWAQMLGTELRGEGAVVKFTREGDQDVPLYDRVEFARQAHADFFLSLHCNALPDSENPFIRHGIGTYYYQSGSRDAAELIHKQLLTAWNLRDDGLYDANFAVVRPTDFPSVLVEAAYLIDPAEERLLQSDEFLRALSRGIVRGLNDCFQRVP